MLRRFPMVLRYNNIKLLLPDDDANQAINWGTANNAHHLYVRDTDMYSLDDPCQEKIEVLQENHFWSSRILANQELNPPSRLWADQRYVWPDWRMVLQGYNSLLRMLQYYLHDVQLLWDWALPKYHCHISSYLDVLLSHRRSLRKSSRRFQTEYGADSNLALFVVVPA